MQPSTLVLHSLEKDYPYDQLQENFEEHRENFHQNVYNIIKTGWKEEDRLQNSYAHDEQIHTNRILIRGNLYELYHDLHRDSIVLCKRLGESNMIYGYLLAELDHLSSIILEVKAGYLYKVYTDLTSCFCYDVIAEDNAEDQFLGYKKLPPWSREVTHAKGCRYHGV